MTEYDCFSLWSLPPPLSVWKVFRDKTFHGIVKWNFVYYIYCFPFFFSLKNTNDFSIVSIIAFWSSGSDGSKWSVWEKYYIKVNEGNNTIWKLMRSIRWKKSNIMRSGPADWKMTDAKENRRTNVTSSDTVVGRPRRTHDDSLFLPTIL